MDQQIPAVDVATTEEVLRILSPDNRWAMMRRRKEYVCELVDAGKNFEQIGEILDCHSTTARKVYAQGKMQRQGWMNTQQRVLIDSPEWCMHCVFYLSHNGDGDFRWRHPECRLGDFTTEPGSICDFFVPITDRLRRPPTCLCPTKQKQAHDRGQR